MTENSLILIEDTPIVPTAMINRSLVVEMGDTLMGIHPQAKEIGVVGMRAVAQLALATGANPLPGTNGIHAWKDWQGKLNIQFGMGYLRGEVESEGGILWVDRPRPMTEDEAKANGLQENEIGSICSGAMRRDVVELLRQMKEVGVSMSYGDAKNEVARTGIGIASTDTKTNKKGKVSLIDSKAGRPLRWTADQRAERDLIRKLCPIMQRAHQNIINGTYEESGADWSIHQFAPKETAGVKQLNNGNGQDVNDIFFDDPAPIATEAEYIEGETITDDEVMVQIPEKEAICTAPAADFFDVATALIDRYAHPNATKNAAKKLGYTAVPADCEARYEMFLAIQEYAEMRNGEDAQPALIDAPPASPPTNNYTE